MPLPFAQHKINEGVVAVVEGVFGRKLSNVKNAAALVGKLRGRRRRCCCVVVFQLVIVVAGGCISTLITVLNHFSNSLGERIVGTQEL